MNSSGLEGVVAAETRLSDVNGDEGRLVIAGAQVEDLAGLPYETVLERLLGEPVTGLGAARVKAFALLPTLGKALDAADGMDALRGSVGQLDGASSPLEVVAATAVFAAAWSRKRAGLPPVAPDASLPHATDYLRMLLGSAPSAAAARAINAYLVTVIDHGMNASTFTARVIASTRSDLVSAVTGALGALKGPLHGGAPGPVLDMLDAVGSPEHAEAWLTKELDAGRRIMGMGHRVYRVRDPRAAVLERALEQLANAAGDQALSKRLPLARGVEKAATTLLKNRYPDRELKANVEFYTATLLDALGVDRAAFTPTFAVGRAGGWVAHALEQRATGRLIRPSSTYVGALPS
ncbi:MAG: citrate synthase [Myxococcaceae bacterium]